MPYDGYQVSLKSQSSTEPLFCGTEIVVLVCIWEASAVLLQQITVVFRSAGSGGILLLNQGSYLFFFFLRFYLSDREITSRQAEGEEEAGSLLSREPDAGLDPRTLGS